MSFEVIYKYHARNEEGSYNKEEVKELKEKVGEPFEEVPLEKLASVVIAQLARRDIWIFDVEISEYKKQKVSFRESKGGIVIKNKKFILNGAANIVVQDIEEKPQHSQQVPQANTNLVVMQTNKNLAAPSNTRPIKWVILDSDERNLQTMKASGLAFTPEKRYPVFSEAPHPNKFAVLVYTTIDDRKREVAVSDEHFVPADQFLQRGFSVSQGSGSNGGGNPKLSYGGVVAEPEMVDIRGKR